MGDAEDVNLLREAYERALATYEGICSTLNCRLIAGTRPTAEDLQRERDAKAVLATARHAYLQGWISSLGGA